MKKKALYLCIASSFLICLTSCGTSSSNNTPIDSEAIIENVIQDQMTIEHIGDVEKTRIIRAGQFNLHYIVRKSKLTDEITIEVTDILRMKDDYKYITFKKNLYIL